MASEPLSEMSISLQFAERQPFTPVTAFEIYKQFQPDYPVIQFANRFGVLGGPAIQPLLATEAFDPRWWFLTPEGSQLVQLQDDTVAFNWRRVVGLKTQTPYPGYQRMIDGFSRALAVWKSTIGLRDTPATSVCSILYDNIWELPEQGVKVSDIFAFWNTVGIQGVHNGPELRWSVAVDGSELAALSRVDISASMGRIVKENEPKRAARLTLSGFSHFKEPDKFRAACDELHQRIHDYLALLTTENTKVVQNG